MEFVGRNAGPDRPQDTVSHGRHDPVAESGKPSAVPASPWKHTAHGPGDAVRIRKLLLQIQVSAAFGDAGHPLGQELPDAGPHGSVF